MRLSLRITLVLTLVLGGLLVGNLAIQHYIVRPSFSQLERREAVKDWERCRDAIHREIEHLGGLCSDWAFWDDAYNYVQGKSEQFYTENLANKQWYVDQRMDILFFVRPDGTVFWSHAANHETGEHVELQWLPHDRLPLDHPLMQVKADKDSKVDGLILTELGPMMVSSRPILTSQYGGPMAGVLIFGRSLDEKTLAGINAQTQVDFTAIPLTSGTISERDQAITASAIRSGKPQITEQSAKRLAVVGVLADLRGQPMLMVKTDLERTITAHGAKSLTFATISLTVASLATLLSLVGLLRWVVIRPLSHLSNHAVRVGACGDLHARINSTRRDEIGQLANELDRMMAKIEEYRNQSLSLSRQAGMAEIATGVLHNVGNVLNSVNVSARMITDNLRTSRLGSLGKLVALIGQEKGRLGEFVTSDSRGKCLPDFLEQLYATLRNDQETVQKEVNQLVSGIEHIKDVVRMQNDSVASSNVIIPTEPTSIMEDAVKINLVSMERHRVHVQREYEPDLPHLPLDKHKVLQILINLISNAKKATCHPNIPERHVTLRVRRVQGGQAIEFQVQDNGVGIAPESTTKLFQHGFSNFADGHGFGLHTGANAANEMKGTLVARSDGSGTGSTFTLTIPLQQPAVAEVVG